MPSDVDRYAGNRLIDRAAEAGAEKSILVSRGDLMINGHNGIDVVLHSLAHRLVLQFFIRPSQILICY